MADDPRDIARKALGLSPTKAPTLTPEQEAALSAPVSPVAAPTIGALNGNFEPQSVRKAPPAFNPVPGGPDPRIDLSNVTTPTTGAAAQEPVSNDLNPRNWNKHAPEGAMAPPPQPTGPVRTVAGYVPTGRNMTTQDGFAPEELEGSQLYRGFELSNRNKAAEKRIEEAKLQADADIAYKTKVEDANNWREQQRAALEAEKNTYVANKLNELDAASKNLSATKINPEQYWDDHGEIGRAHV